MSFLKQNQINRTSSSVRRRLDFTPSYPEGSLNANAASFTPLKHETKVTLKASSPDFVPRVSKTNRKTNFCYTNLEIDFPSKHSIIDLSLEEWCHGAKCRETVFLMPVYGGNFCQYHQKKIYQCRKEIIHQPKTIAEYQQSYIARLREQQLRRVWDSKHMEAVMLLEKFLQYIKSSK